MTDTLETILNLARAIQATPEQLVQAAALLTGGSSTLLADVTALEAAAGRPVLGSYPTARRRILYGEPAAHGLPELPGFGQESRFAFTAPVAAARAALVQQLAAARQLASGQHFAERDPRVHGWGASDEYVDACRALGKLLHQAGLLGGDPMASLRRLTHGRLAQPQSRALTGADLRQYLTVVLATSRDPVLDAWLWLFFRCTGARRSEALRVNVPHLDAHTRSVQLLRKGPRNGVQPLTGPVLEGLLAFTRSRPGAEDEAVFRDRAGRRVTARGSVERWSRELHRSVAWATGRELCVHLFRHVIAHEVEHATGRSTAAAVFLGHDARQQHGTVWVYATDGTFAEAAEIAAACYGWPDRWPTALPEWSLLARALGLDPGAES